MATKQEQSVTQKPAAKAPESQAPVENVTEVNKHSHGPKYIKPNSDFEKSTRGKTSL